MIATYSLSQYLVSFEFFNWLVMVHADGASKVCFDLSQPKLKNFTLPDVVRRFKSIVEPGPALAGLQSYEGTTETRLRANASELLPWYNTGRRFDRLKSVKQPAKCDFTVTLRSNRAGARARDSNCEVWTKFAERIGAKVIKDFYDEEVHLHDRVAMYAGAKMNFGVCNGPVHMISLTEYPVAMFVNTQSARNSQMRWGMKPGQSYPWMLENQSLIWRSDDDLDTMLRVFDGMKL